MERYVFKSKPLDDSSIPSVDGERVDGGRRRFLRMLAAAGIAALSLPEDVHAARGADTRFSEDKVNRYDAEFKAFLEIARQKREWPSEIRKLNYKPSYDRGDSLLVNRPELLEAIVQIGTEYKMDLALIYAFIAVESNWNPNAQNGEARGLTQMRVEAASDTGVDYGQLISKPAVAIEGGFRYILTMMDAARKRFPRLTPDQHIGVALRMYNKGPNADDSVLLNEGNMYSLSVMKALQDYFERNAK